MRRRSTAWRRSSCWRRPRSPSVTRAWSAPSSPPASSWTWRRSASPATRSSCGRTRPAAIRPRRFRPSSGCACCSAMSSGRHRRRSYARSTSRCSPPRTRRRARRGAGAARCQPVLAKTDEAPFVGRESALGTAAAARWQPPRAASAASCSRRASPGSARRAWPAAFAREAHAGGAIVLYGRSDEEALAPYQPFVDVISHLVLNGQVDRLGDEPPLRARGARPPGAGAPPPGPGRAARPPAACPRPSATGSSRPMVTHLARVAGEQPAGAASSTTCTGPTGPRCCC